MHRTLGERLNRLVMETLLFRSGLVLSSPVHSRTRWPTQGGGLISLAMQQVQPIHDTLVTPHTVHEPGAIPSYHTSIPHTQSTPPCVTLPSRYITQQHAHRVVYRMYLSRVSQPAFISHCDVLAGKLRLGLVYYHIRRSKTLGTQSRT